MTVRFLSEAASDVVLAREWYEGQHPGLGDDFVQSLERLVGLLSDLPEAFPERGGPKKGTPRTVPIRRLLPFRW